MREGQPSLTAIWVAFARALAAREHELSAACSDMVATKLLPRSVSTLIEGRDGHVRNQSLFQVARELGFGLFDHLALRTAIIDEALLAALNEGVDQVVLLGAGLDSRAHRIEAARHAIVFEVDHPNTQAYKQKRAANLPVSAREVRYAACDFERVTLEQALASVAFDPTRPSVWIWEGVTMYLRESAMLATLDTLARLTVPGSVLLASYVTPELASVGPVLGRLGTGLLAAISEPVRSSFEPSEIAHILESRQLRVQSDELPLEVAARFGIRHLPFSLLTPTERIVVAKRIDA